MEIEAKTEQKAPEYGLYTAEIRVTNACNLSCKHCSVSAGRKLEDELTFEEIKSIISQLSDMHVLHVVFTGGEPMLREDIYEMIRFTRDKKIEPYIDTNATLIGKKEAEKLKASGLENAQVSLDGDKKKHNYIRGKKAFERAVRGIKALIEAGINVNINFVVSKANIGEIERVAGIASSLKAKSMSIERLVSTGRAAENKKMLGISSEEFNGAIERAMKVGEIENLRINISDPLKILFDNNFIEKNRERAKHAICGGCIAGVAAITISHNGDVLACPKLPIKLGNIRQKSIREIWLSDNNSVLRKLRYRELEGKCRECELKNMCGGCRAFAFAEKGDYLYEDSLCWI